MDNIAVLICIFIILHLMPFTFSHPAIILPVKIFPKKYYSFSAIIMGSMTPDFEYFIRIRDYSKYSHTLSGAVWFDIPLGMALLFLFHNLVRNPLIEYLPFSLNVRFSALQKFNWNKYFNDNIIVVIFSLFIGILSHIFWDSFTHDSGYFAQAIPFLRREYNVLNYNITGANIFQYLGSLLGAIAIILFIAKMPEGRNTKQKNIISFWLPVSIITIIVLNARVCIDYLFDQKEHEDIVVTIISGALIGIIALCIYIKEKDKKESYKKLYKIRNKVNK